MSKAPQKKFSPGDSENDPRALAQALEHVSISHPKAIHAVFRDKEKKAIQVPRFTTHTLPDVSANTRIVAVVGLQQKVAAPQEDGWFLSDFFAFWNMLQGATSVQTWLHCLDLDGLVKEHGRYLHGNPFKERKVVLDKDILDMAKKSPHGPKQVGHTLLISNFQKQIRQECLAAQKSGNPNESVLILIFGHGDGDNFGIYPGSDKNLFDIKSFERATRSMKVNVTILSTACFSGGWACSPRLNTTTLAAAADNQVSKSWAYSGSSGRACGSMFTTAIIEKLTRAEGSTRSVFQPIDDEHLPPPAGSDETYAEFVESVYEGLLNNVDRRGFLHGLTFSAQDDAWEMHWSDRTGIPLANFKARWDMLPDWPADETLMKGDFKNRDPHITAEEEALFVAAREADEGVHVWRGKVDYTGKGAENVPAKGSVLGKRKTSGLNGMTPEAIREKVIQLGRMYMGSHEGNDDTGPDGALHHMLDMIVTGKNTDPQDVEEAYEKIRYRMEVQSTADDYLTTMNLPPPKGLKCCEYNTNRVSEEIGLEKYRAIRDMMTVHTFLFPRPNDKQGHYFVKGKLYLMAAFHQAGLSKKAIQQKLDELAQGINEDLERRQQLLRADENISSKRQKLRKFYPDLSQ